MEAKKLLVTGADGLLGSAICRGAMAFDLYPLTHTSCDLTDFHATKAIFNFVRPDFVIHTAAVVGGIGSNMNHPGRFFCTNIAINNNVLESARLTGVKTLISYMSTCVFPDAALHPLKIEDIHNGPPHPSNAAYAHAKRMLDVQSRAYRTEWGCNFITLVPANMYGPNDNWDLQNAHVLPSLVHRCWLAKQQGVPLEVWGTGKPLREFLFVDDIALLSLLALGKYTSPEPLIISSGVENTIAEAVSLITNYLNFTEEVCYLTDKPDGQYRKPSDLTKFREVFPTWGFTPLSDGLERTIRWFVEHYPQVRGVL